MTELKQANLARVLRQIIVDGQTTRASVAGRTGLSIQTVSNLVAELIDLGLICESGQVSSRGGRPITLIERRPAGAYLIGVDVGERGIAVEFFDFTLTRIDQVFGSSETTQTPAAIRQYLGEALTTLETRNPTAWPRVVGVGLGLPGVVEPASGVQLESAHPAGSSSRTELRFDEQILYAQSLGWAPVAISELMSTDLPVFAQNGAKVHTKGEQWFGALRDTEHAVVVLIGRGVGLGLISGGVLLEGSHGSAGEWGHVRIEDDGRPCRCGGHGCLETYVGADGLLTSWADAGGEFDGTGSASVECLIASSTPAATRVVDQAIARLGRALGGIVNVMNPERIVIGGWVGQLLMATRAQQIDHAIRDNALDRAAHQFTLYPSTFGGDSVAMGAATLPMEVLIQTPAMLAGR
jgi:predicted NBD/HSP70 family sugar kinase